MKTEIQKQIIVTIHLDEKEAMWLKNLVQNPLCHPDKESKEDKQFREKFWNELKEIGI